jgi:hypothetical protein
MTAPAAQPQAAFVQECGTLATGIAAARQAIGRGETADLAVLAERLRLLLEAFAGGEVDQRRGELARLLGLAEEIEALGGLISEECRRCSEQLARGGASARAAAAYASRARG